MEKLNRPNHAAGRPRGLHPAFHQKWKSETETLEDLVGLGVPGHLALRVLSEIQTGHIRHVFFAASIIDQPTPTSLAHDRA